MPYRAFRITLSKLGLLFFISDGEHQFCTLKALAIVRTAARMHARSIVLKNEVIAGGSVAGPMLAVKKEVAPGGIEALKDVR